jgi:hypothetical protein
LRNDAERVGRWSSSPVHGAEVLRGFKGGVMRGKVEGVLFGFCVVWFVPLFKIVTGVTSFFCN